MQTNHCEVLVAGAGPVGLFTALQLARKGVQVQIIDEGDGPAAQSYACALHPASLVLLREAGLHASLLRAGRRIDRVVYYEDTLRRAQLDFVRFHSDMPFLLCLPQNELEQALVKALAEYHVPVLWNHRLTSIAQPGNGIVATIDELSGTATGYDVPRWEMAVKRTFQTQAQFAVGCDGQRSVVRREAGIESEYFGEPQLFVVYEFDCTLDIPDELRVVLNPQDTNVLWPMRDHRYRWSFQWTETPPDGEFPTKERSHLWFEDKPVAQRTQEHLLQLLRARAPWFDGEVSNMDWATDVQFRRRLVRTFGAGRLWLAGDAAHQTGPVGVQSLNVGLIEANELAAHLQRALRTTGSVVSLDEYGEHFRAEWLRLLGATIEIEPSAKPSDLPLRNRRDLIACLPGSGPDIDRMLATLGFGVRTLGQTVAA